LIPVEEEESAPRLVWVAVDDVGNNNGRNDECDDGVSGDAGDRLSALLLPLADAAGDRGTIGNEEKDGVLNPDDDGSLAAASALSRL
jgi:hypothetical protein